MAKKKAASSVRGSQRSGTRSGKSTGRKQATTAKAPAARASEPRKPGERRYWLVKSEPHVFSIDDLANEPQQTTYWDGVRNYQARNTMRDEMKLGDLVLFYHSNAEPPGIAGICKVVREGYPDFTAFDPQDEHFDPKSKQSAPTWFMVDLKLVKKFRRELPLPELKANSELDGMPLLQKGSRLSVQPVSADHFELIKRLGGR